MLKDAPLRSGEGDHVEFWQAGMTVQGEFHCSECGYGVSVFRALPTCPMCGGEAWEPPARASLDRRSPL